MGLTNHCTRRATLARELDVIFQGVIWMKNWKLENVKKRLKDFMDNLRIENDSIEENGIYRSISTEELVRMMIEIIRERSVKNEKQPPTARDEVHP